MSLACRIALMVAVPSCLFLAWQMFKLSRELNRDQKRGYKLNRSAPTWLEGDK